MISKEIGLPELESIEQAVIEFKLLPRDRSKNQPGRIMTGDWVVRTTKDFAWISSIKMIMKPNGTPRELVEVKFENRTYYKTVGSTLFGTGVCFYCPDARTLICTFHEEHLRRQIKEGPSRLPEFLRGNDWNQVDGALVAVAIDNRGQTLKLDLQSDDPEDLVHCAAIAKCESMGGGPRRRRARQVSGHRHVLEREAERGGRPIRTRAHRAGAGRLGRADRTSAAERTTWRTRCYALRAG